ncbi:ABC transporter ATP-binding protein [Cellvibrio mixtus]|uniref:ABC transporter ATP-binding protein n=1 Tax=Cellvibrio mixtus TaxID=39650 RepID=UPI000A4A8CCD|nr:ABC transporter ATP-binding protein [Cellvibrio mixtus]
MNQAQIKQQAETAKTMFAMENISKVYRTELIETHALRDFTLQVNEGEFVAITGPSGSGKTTFLNIAGLLETYSSGHYFLDGVNTRDLNDKQLSHLRNTKIGFVFQGFNLIPDLNAYDNIEVPLRYRNMNRSERKDRVQQALARVGLESRAKHFPAQLSGGQQQRIAVARAIAGSPAFILADEPTGNLDSLMARQVMELLENINDQGTTIIMVTHDQDLARRTQRHVQIIDGQVTEMFKHF